MGGRMATKTDGVKIDARAEILRRIRSARRAGPVTDAAMSRLAAAEEWSAIPREYRRSASRSREAGLDLLEDRLRDYDANVVHTSRSEVSASIGRMLAERGRPLMVVPMGFPQEMLPEDGKFAFDEGMSARELDQVEGVLTLTTVAIAETGTLVLQNVAGQGRRVATLVPDYHLCVVHVSDVVETVPEAMDRLAATADLPTTFVSGPSATADIEMTRIKGVHGPRFLDVLIVE